MSDPELRTTSAMASVFEALTNDVTAQMQALVAEQSEQLKKLLEKAVPLNIKVRNKNTRLEGLRHSQLETLLIAVAQKLPVIMVGPAGTGKTHAAGQVAEALDLDFYPMSVGSQTSKSDIIGFISANGDYIETAFRKAYEHGGVFLMDEIDAGNSNVIIQINAALSNNYCSFPDKVVEKSPDFYFVASANTFGDGASRQYVGRNQLDAATMDRFVTIEWMLDEDLESAFCGNSSDAQKWVAVVRAVRKWTNDNVQRVIVSPRASERGSALLNAGMEFEDVVRYALLGAFPEDKKEKIMELAKEAWKESTKKSKKDVINVPLGSEEEPKPKKKSWNKVVRTGPDGTVYYEFNEEAF